jgi:hypothetical protein
VPPCAVTQQPLRPLARAGTMRQAITKASITLPRPAPCDRSGWWERLSNCATATHAFVANTLHPGQVAGRPGFSPRASSPVEPRTAPSVAAATLPGDVSWRPALIGLLPGYLARWLAGNSTLA